MLSAFLVVSVWAVVATWQSCKEENDKYQAVVEVDRFYMGKITELKKQDPLLSRAHDLIFIWADTTHGAEERREASRIYTELRDSVRNEVNLWEAARSRAIDSVLGIERPKPIKEPGSEAPDNS